MSEKQADCCGPSGGQTADQPTPTDRWLGTRLATDAPLPADMATILSQFYSVASVETLDDFVTATLAEAEGGSISLTDLCHVTEETPHVATTADETYYFRCFYDGIALAYLTDDAVDIQTESPSGTVIEIHATSDGDVDTTPPGTVMSFGVATAVGDNSDTAPIVEAVYEAICPYVKRFLLVRATRAGRQPSMPPQSDCRSQRRCRSQPRSRPRIDSHCPTQEFSDNNPVGGTR